MKLSKTLTALFNTTAWRRGLVYALLFLLPAIVSCHTVSRGVDRWFNRTAATQRKPATPVRHEVTSADSVGIEVFTIRVSLEQNDLFRQLWLEVDEQMLEPTLRRELIGHGLRVGFLGETLSPSLARLINVTGERTAESKTNYGDFQEVSLAELSKDPAVTRQYVTLLPDMRAALKIFDERLPEFSRFWTEGGQLCGQTYTDVMGLICIKGETLPNEKARLTIVPELEYGVTETRYRSFHGMSIQESGRPRHQYKSLTVSLDLLAGQWIILGPVSRDCTGAGRAFFIRGNQDGEQKIMAIRLAKLKRETPSNLSRPEGPGGGTNLLIPERN